VVELNCEPRAAPRHPAQAAGVSDEQAIELALFLSLATQVGHARADIAGWLSEMVHRLKVAVVSHGRYPAALTDYPDLLAHPKAQTDEYRQEVTPGSVLIPLLLAFAARFGDLKSIASLEELIAGPLAHCTLQLWLLPDEESEKHFYLNDAVHGAALADLPTSAGGKDLLKILFSACKTTDWFNSLSAIRVGCFPLILTACRHYRLPVPPQYWISLLLPPETDTTSAV
jgi:hypothetical protein